MDFEMTPEEIKANAPEGATDYKFWKCGGVDYIAVHGDGIYAIWFNGQWIPLPYQHFSKPLKINPLHGE